MNSFLNAIYKITVNGFLKPFTILSRQLKKNLFFKSKVAVAVKGAMKDFMAVLKRAPEKKTDYVLLGSRYYAKRLLSIALVLFVLVATLGTTLIMPKLRGWLFTPSIALSDPALTAYQGKVKLLNREQIVIYEGTMLAGKCEGKGKQYDDKGHLIYEGDFKADLYEGEGILYDGKGNRLYEGSFLANVFHGIGKKYQAEGKLLYEGEFANGNYMGSGKLYATEGYLSYSGAFAQGLKNGYGVSYFGSGLIEYNGGYLNDHYHGEGTLFNEQGVKIYSGTFSNHQFEGYGKKYFDNTVVRYEGNFSNAQYSGLGKLFSEDGNLLYEGSFLENEYSGLGKLYSGENGKLRYQGTFEGNQLTGLGDYYNGEKVFSGSWVEGRAMVETLLGKAAADGKLLFFENSQTIEMGSTYSLYFKKAGAALVLNYPTELMEPAISSVIVSRNYHQAYAPTMTLDQFKMKLAPGSYKEKTLLFSTAGNHLTYKEFTDAKQAICISIKGEGFDQKWYFDTATKLLLFIEYSQVEG